MLQLDETDRVLMALLRENARMAVADLARRLGLSRTTVQSRIERLERRSLIVGYTTRTSDEYALAQVKAHVMIVAAPKLAARVEAELRKILELKLLYSVSGQVDYIAILEAATVAELDQLIDRIGALDGVERTTSSVVLSTKISR